jgi:hypothetical protein
MIEQKLLKLLLNREDSRRTKRLELLNDPIYRLEQELKQLKKERRAATVTPVDRVVGTLEGGTRGAKKLISNTLTTLANKFSPS